MGPIAAGAILLFALPSSRAAYAPSAEGTKVAAATDHADATRAALEVMSAGGNAVDGAIAAALALGVVSPAASGLGGGGFALVYTAKDKKVTVLDFRETAPTAVNGEAIVTRAPGAFAGLRGAAIGVPGEPAGLEALSQRFGRRSLGDDAQPAVHLADRGFYVGRHLSDSIVDTRDRVNASRELSSMFLRGGTPLAFATLVRRPELARTLLRYGAGGRGTIYEGPTAEKIVAASRAAGGSVGLSDLSGYRVRQREPLTRVVDGRTIVTMPAPSAGGLMLLETLETHGAGPSSPLAQMGMGSSAYVHVLAETMRGAVADRVRLAGDPDLEPGVAAAYDSALAPAQIAARKARLDLTKTHAGPEFKTREQGTSHLVVTDAEGNVVSLTTTVNSGFGSGVVAGDTGILLNNELDDFSSPNDVAGFGVIGLGPNRPRPSARPVSSMTPTLVLENGEPLLAAGGSGGTRIATGVTEAVVARLVFGRDPSACVSSPRFHVGTTADIFVDKDTPEDVRAGLAARGELVKDEPFGGSAVQMIAWERTGGKTRILAASDPRKEGFAAAQ